MPENLKVLIVSTPKTGNTWIKFLLAALYRLPVREPTLPLDLTQFAAWGPRWVAHQHLWPSTELLDWLREEHVTVITTVRHPADVLVSLYHYVRTATDRSSFDVDLQALATAPAQPASHHVDESVATYVRDRFWNDLLISLSWLRTGVSQRVRYEDLWRDPVATLQALTAPIAPVSIDAIDLAVEQCQIDLVRQLPGIDRTFFRHGRVGDWRTAVPASIVALLRDHEPYPTLFAALGYTLDPTDPLIATPARPRASRNPFQGSSQFDNGVPVAALLVRLFLSVPSERSRQWPPITLTDPGSFYAWMNSPAEADPDPWHAIFLTNLAAFIHSTRADLQDSFPDLFGHDRLGYALWFVGRAQVESEIAATQVRPVRDALLAWAREPAEEDPDNGQPVLLTRLAMHVYGGRPDVRAAFPDVYGQDRIRYAQWFCRRVPVEYEIDEAFVHPVWKTFVAWATAPADHRRAKSPPVMITKLAAAIHAGDPGLQERFPDLYAHHRVDYMSWLLAQGRLEYEMEAELLWPIVRSWAEAGR